MAKRNVIT